MDKPNPPEFDLSTAPGVEVRGRQLLIREPVHVPAGARVKLGGWQIISMDAAPIILGKGVTFTNARS